ncbi:MAG: hypothetical protein RSC04_05675 [Bacteroidales bacterium]
MKTILLLLVSFFLISCANGYAQTFDNRSLKEGQVIKVLVFSKNASKRSMYSIGSTLKIKTVQGQKIKGSLNYINDTMLIIAGQRILIKNIVSYYKSLSTCLVLGSASAVAGAGYIVLDAINNGINDRHPTTSAQTWIVGGSFLAAAAVLLPFKEVQRKTSVWRPKILNIDPLLY